MIEHIFFNLIRFITGLEVDELSADIHTFVKGRLVDDNAQIMLRFKGGAKGAIWSSQVAVGNENNLKIRIFGENGLLGHICGGGGVLELYGILDPTFCKAGTILLFQNA